MSSAYGYTQALILQDEKRSPLRRHDSLSPNKIFTHEMKFSPKPYFSKWRLRNYDLMN